LSEITKYRKVRLFASGGIFLLFFSVLNIRCLFAVSPENLTLDSLLKSATTAKGNEKVDALNQLCEYALPFSVAQSRTYAGQALQLAVKIRYTLGMAKAYENLALTEIYHGGFYSSINTISRAIRIYRHLKEYESLYRSLLRLAGLYQYLDNNTKVIETYLDAMNMATENGRIDQQAAVSQSLCMYFLSIGDYSNAKFYVSKAMLYAKMSKKNDYIGLANCAMADYYSAINQDQVALDYFHASLNILSANGEKSKMAIPYVHLGNHLVNNKQYDSAIVYYERALKINTYLNEIISQSNVYTSMAHVYQQQMQLYKALKYQMIALKMRQDYGHLSLVGSSYTNIGTVYSLLKDYPKALYYYTEGLNIALKTHRIDYIKFNYQRIYNLYTSRKDYKKALDINLLLNAINDSILKTESQQKYAEFQYKYENERRFQNINFLTKENELQKLSLDQTRFTIYILAAILILLSIIGALIFHQSKLKTRERQMELEQKLLRSQMNPHFIFNALIAIQSFIFKNESSEATHYITSFARLIRLVLSNSREEFVIIQREIDTLSNYLSLQKMRFENKFDYSLVVDPDLETELIKIPPMLAQPFVENAIEYGIYGMSSPGRIVVSIREEYSNIFIEVTDNRTGSQKAKEIADKSGKTLKPLTTRIAEDRIANLNRKYKRKIHLQIIDLFDENMQPSGTKVQLIIPEY
jgi:tetratricopeptide (TPR) repeat protein